MLVKSVSILTLIGGLLSLAVPACAGEARDTARFETALRESRPDTAAPVGLIDFCLRQPAQCQTPGQGPEQLQRQAKVARQDYWRQVFTSRGASAAEPSAMGRRPTRRRNGVRSATTPTDLGVQAEARLTVGGSGWALVESVNREINRSMLQTEDQRQYAVSDYWTVPLARPGTRARGDCEDFVLAKRAALIARGIPDAALSIALVTTPWNEPHAVLLVSSDRGDYVLDSLDNRISHWSRVDLTWRSRQRPGNILKWIDLAGV